jgi:2-amino-4-hydroxy-6-hydroxymethyldihydropteridine diphosphokinase
VIGQVTASCAAAQNYQKEQLIVTATTRLFIGLGANLTPAGFDTPQAGCEAALKMLGNLGVKIVKTSSWYESAPVPPSDQPWYLNAVAEAVTASDAASTLAVLHQVEAHFGRQRSTSNAARVLDLDLLDFGGQIHHLSQLTLPHPRLHERAFVLLPLRDLVDDWMHPETGTPLDALITQLPAGQLIRRKA